MLTSFLVVATEGTASRSAEIPGPVIGEDTLMHNVECMVAQLARDVGRQHCRIVQNVCNSYLGVFSNTLAFESPANRGN